MDKISSNQNLTTNVKYKEVNLTYTKYKNPACNEKSHTPTEPKAIQQEMWEQKTEKRCMHYATLGRKVIQTPI